MKKTSVLFLILLFTMTTFCTKEVKIKDFPIAMQCWTFRKFTFLHTLDKVQNLNIKYLEAYPGQILDSTNADIKFDHNLSNDMIEVVHQKLNEHGLQIVSYGVVGFENNEESMRKVFDFAKIMGIKTIVSEPSFDDYSLIEKMVQEYGINIAIHNHPTPSKYAYPDTVLSHIKGLDKRIGACADTGHWLRTGVVPVEALKLLNGRITNVHLKDLDQFGVKEAVDVPFGSGKADIRGVLTELSRQNYSGYLSVEHENPDEVYSPEASIQKGLEYIRSIVGER